MLTLKSKTLLFLLAACGLGIGVLSPLSDGLYSAMLLFCFPFVVAFVTLAIISDLNRTPMPTSEPRLHEKKTRIAVALGTRMANAQKAH